MNQIKTIILIVLLIISILLGGLYLNNKSTINRLTNNIEQIGNTNSTLIFKNNELKSYLKDKDTEHKREVDSILKVHKVKIKNLIYYSKINNQIIDADTTIITSNESKIQNDSIYRKELKYYKNCLKMSGYVLTKDSTTEAFITNVESLNNIYITKSYKKSFWDYIFFRKGEEVIQTTSDCGKSTIDNIDIK